MKAENIAERILEILKKYSIPGTMELVKKIARALHDGNEKMIDALCYNLILEKTNMADISTNAFNLSVDLLQLHVEHLEEYLNQEPCIEPIDELDKLRKYYKTANLEQGNYLINKTIDVFIEHKVSKSRIGAFSSAQYFYENLYEGPNDGYKFLLGSIGRYLISESTETIDGLASDEVEKRVNKIIHDLTETLI